MEEGAKRRLVGAAVLVVLLVIFLPMLLEKESEPPVSKQEISIPPRPDFDRGHDSAVWEEPDDHPVTTFREYGESIPGDAPQSPEPSSTPESSSPRELAPPPLFETPETAGPRITPDLAPDPAPDLAPTSPVAGPTPTPGTRFPQSRPAQTTPPPATAPTAARIPRPVTTSPPATPPTVKKTPPPATAATPRTAPTAKASPPPRTAPTTKASPPPRTARKPAQVASASPPVSTQAGVNLSSWVIQVTSLSERKRAYAMVEKLRAQGFPAYLQEKKINRKMRYRVRIGPVGERKRIESMATSLQTKTGLKGQIQRYP